jgi:hypothetical protein
MHREFGATLGRKARAKGYAALSDKQKRPSELGAPESKEIGKVSCAQ